MNIKVTVGVADRLSGANGFTLVSVTSNEPDSGLDGGDLPGDIVGWATDPAIGDRRHSTRPQLRGAGSGVLSLGTATTTALRRRSFC